MNNIKCKFCNAELKSVVQKNNWGTVCNCKTCGVYTYDRSYYENLTYGSMDDIELSMNAIWLFYNKKSESDYKKGERIYVGNTESFEKFCSQINDENEKESYKNLTKEIAEAFFNMDIEEIEGKILHDIAGRSENPDHIAVYTPEEVMGLGFAIRTMADDRTNYNRYIYYLNDLASMDFLEILSNGSDGKDIKVKMLPRGIRYIETNATSVLFEAPPEFQGNKGCKFPYENFYEIK